MEECILGQRFANWKEILCLKYMWEVPIIFLLKIYVFPWINEVIVVNIISDRQGISSENDRVTAASESSYESRSSREHYSGSGFRVREREIFRGFEHTRNKIVVCRALALTAGSLLRMRRLQDSKRGWLGRHLPAVARSRMSAVRYNGWNALSSSHLEIFH